MLSLDDTCTYFLINESAFLSTLVNSAAICLANPHIHMKEITRCVLSMAMVCALMCGTDSEIGNLIVITYMDHDLFIKRVLIDLVFQRSVNFMQLLKVLLLQCTI